MNKINFLKEKIVVKQNSFYQAINSGKVFGIDHKGEISYEPFKKNLYIYIGKGALKSSKLATNRPPSIHEALGDKYKIFLKGHNIEIDPSAMWQNILKINSSHSDYEDNSIDGIDAFSDKKLEEIGWHCADFDVTYRDIVEELEERVDGVLAFIETQTPYNFSGFAIINDIESAREIAFNFAKSEIERKIKEADLFVYEELDENMLEVVKFFKIGREQ